MLRTSPRFSLVSRVSFVPTNRPLSLLLFYSSSLGPSACFPLPFSSLLFLALSSLTFLFPPFISSSSLILSYPPLRASFLSSPSSFTSICFSFPSLISFFSSLVSSVLSHLGRQLSKRSKEVLLLLLLPPHVPPSPSLLTLAFDIADTLLCFPSSPLSLLPPCRIWYLASP